MQFKRLWDEWRAAKKEPDAPEAWKGRLGFEEWYVDNVAAWAYGEYKNKKPKNATESYFKRLVNKLKKMFNEMRKTFQRRFQGGNVHLKVIWNFWRVLSVMALEKLQVVQLTKLIQIRTKQFSGILLRLKKSTTLETIQTS